MRELLARLRDWLRRDRLDAELAEELRFHRDHIERDARAEGIRAHGAAYTARRQLGNTTRLTEEARDRWSVCLADGAPAGDQTGRRRSFIAASSSQYETVTEFEQVDVPTLHTLYVRDPLPRPRLSAYGDAGSVVR